MDEKQILKDYENGLPVKEIAERNGIHHATVSVVAKRAGLRRLRRGPEIIEDAEWMAAGDQSLTTACDRLNMKPDTLWRTCKRYGRLDIYDRLADRESNGDMRRWVREAKRRPTEAVA